MVFLHQKRLIQNTKNTLTLRLFQEEFNKVTNKTIEVLFTEEQRGCGPINTPRSKGIRKGRSYQNTNSEGQNDALKAILREIKLRCFLK